MIARRVAQELQDGERRQSRLRHLGQRAAHPARGRPARRRHLGDRAGRRRRRAAARLPVRLRLQCRGHHAVALPVHLFPGRRLRRLAAVLPADRPRRLGQRLEARRPAACDGRRRRLRRHHRAGEEDRLLRLSSMPAPSSRSTTAGCVIEKEGKVKKLVETVEHVSFSGRRAVEQGQDITYVTERCVMRLTPRRRRRHRDRAGRRSPARRARPGRSSR